MRGITGVDLFGTTDAVVKHVLEVLIFTARGWIWAVILRKSQYAVHLFIPSTNIYRVLIKCQALFEVLEIKL